LKDISKKRFKRKELTYLEESFSETFTQFSTGIKRELSLESMSNAKASHQLKQLIKLSNPKVKKMRVLII